MVVTNLIGPEHDPLGHIKDRVHRQCVLNAGDFFCCNKIHSSIITHKSPVLFV